MSNLAKQVFMEMTRSLARLSKCVSMDVGCMFVSNRGRIVASGVNGTVSGAENCCDKFKSAGPEHSAWSADNEIHAEMNMILELARGSQTITSGDVYCTHSPCPNCMKHLMGLQEEGRVKINNLFFGTKYYRVSDEELAEQIFRAKLKYNVNMEQVA